MESSTAALETFARAIVKLLSAMLLDSDSEMGQPPRVLPFKIDVTLEQE